VFRTARVIAATAGALFLSLGVLGGTAQADTPSAEITCTHTGEDSLGWDLVPNCLVTGRLG
jgi:hypothetical protein